MRRLAMAGARSSSDEHGEHAGQRRAAAGVDRCDQRMRMRTAHEGGVQRIGRRDVADIAPGAGEQGTVFDTGQAGTDGAHSVSSSISRSSCTGRTVPCHRAARREAIQ